ncbi:O-antigen ligase family protein [Gordonia rubripertincta]|uniref:O-antigen ligase family protein n=1 Tax=Gordonia rubripertincta TaxID=36822 RepID=UPI0015F9DDB2|nr:O-antigen ligase family protein [Gordonia rubripertincta]QMU22880.1 O-antigen ligase family protein [Gordonia rubripertincta]
MLELTLPLTGFITATILLRQFYFRRIAWDAGSWLIFLVGWVSIVPALLAKLRHQVIYQLDAQMQVVSETLVRNPRLEAALYFLTVCAAGALLLRVAMGGSRRQMSLFGAMFIATSLIAMLSNLNAWVHLVTGQPAVLLALLLAATFATPSREGAISGAAVFALSVAIVGTALVLYDRSIVFMECTAKCTFAGEIFMAATTHGNTLGLIMAVSIPFVWLAFSNWTKWWMLAFVIFNLALSGSRSALAVGLITMVVLGMSNPSLRDGIGRGRTFIPLGAAAAVSVLVAIVLPLVERDDTALTGRGGLWNIALNAFEDNPLIGGGITAWDTLYNQGAFGAAAAYSTHNQWVEVLLLAGLAGALTFGIGVLALFLGSQSSRYVTLAVFLPIAALGATERPLSFGLLNTLTWVLVALVMVSTGTNYSSLFGVEKRLRRSSLQKLHFPEEAGRRRRGDHEEQATETDRSGVKVSK